MDANTASTGIPWYIWALMTVLCWGTYGVCMHTGSIKMVDTPENAEHGRIMAFLWVGLAYFLTAVIAPLIILKLNGGPVNFWAYPVKGWQWSLIAGTLGAIGALGVLLAFGAAPKTTPTGLYVPVIMSIIFAGAPIVNAVVNTTKSDAWGNVSGMFILGILLAAVGGFLVTKYVPKPLKSPPQAPANSAATETK